MTLTILRYIPRAVIDVVADILAWVLAPIASLPVFITTDKNGREQIHPIWQWITTHDAPIDIFAYTKDGLKHKRLKEFDRTTPANNSAWLKYINRILWIWRNPAYQVSHWLGYDQKGVKITKHADNEDTWDSGSPSYAYWIAVNAKGEKAFLYEKQWYYWRGYCVEMQFGWKLYRDDPDQKCMLAFRFHPFKHYPK